MYKKNKNPQQIESLIGHNNFNVDYFLKIIEKNLIKASVLSELLKYKIPRVLKTRLSDIAKKSIIETSLHNQYLKKELANILKSLNKNKIESLLMKGLSINYSTLRTNRDIDILIHKKDLLKAIDILKEEFGASDTKGLKG